MLSEEPAPRLAADAKPFVEGMPNDLSRCKMPKQQPLVAGVDGRSSEQQLHTSPRNGRCWPM